MCGIFLSSHSVVNDKSLATIEQCLSFRGPDYSSALITHLGWKAYHSRLSIIDINSSVHQPLIDNNGGMLVFNGEILNYKELGVKYFNEVYTSDTKLLSDLLSLGIIDLNELDGFFAFVYIGNNGKLQNAVRDKFGVKPLFYYKDKYGISFSSEPNLLKKLFNLSVNKTAIEEYYAVRSPIFSGSFFNSVDSVHPGHCLSMGCYFDCKTLFNQSNYEASINDTFVSLKKGISSRLVSDVPIGLLLSKGIDSNLIKELGSFTKYYSIGFSGDDDLEYLKKEDIKNLTISECTPKEYINSFNYLLNLRGEPMSVPNEVLLYRIAKIASADGIKVLLSGEGADEFFGGYDRIFKWAAQAENFDIEKFLILYCYDPPLKGSRLFKIFQQLFNDNNLKSVFETVRWFFIRYHMPILFRRLDFSLMAAGVEGREPIANYHVFKEAVKFSSSQLMCGDLGKIPLRKIIKEYKGEEFAFEKKVGFPVDLTKIFHNPDKLSSYDLWFKENLKVLE